MLIDTTLCNPSTWRTFDILGLAIYSKTIDPWTLLFNYTTWLLLESWEYFVDKSECHQDATENQLLKRRKRTACHNLFRILHLLRLRRLRSIEKSWSYSKSKSHLCLTDWENRPKAESWIRAIERIFAILRCNDRELRDPSADWGSRLLVGY